MSGQKNPAVRRLRDLAEKEGFEPSKPFRGLHDFQSCALDQLGDFSRSRSGKQVFVFCDSSIIIAELSGMSRGKFRFPAKSVRGRFHRIACPAAWHTKFRHRPGDGGTGPAARCAAWSSPGRFPARRGIGFPAFGWKSPFVCRRPPENDSLFAMFVKMPIDGTAKTDYDGNKFICFRRAGNRTPRGRKTLGKRRAAHVYSGNHREQ